MKRLCSLCTIYLLIVLLPFLLMGADSRLDELIRAAQTGDTARAVELLRAGIDPNGQSAQDGRTPLMMAARVFSVEGNLPFSAGIPEHLKLIDILLEHGADIHAQQEGPVREACLGSLEVVQHLLKKGARVDVECLGTAAGASQTAIFDHLIGLGIDPKQRLKNGGTLFHSVALGYDMSGMSEELLQAFWSRIRNLGVSLNATDASGKTPLHMAVAENHMRLMHWLIAQGADIEALDHERRTPVMIAARLWSPSCLHSLIQAGAQLDRRDNAGLNVVDHAEQGGIWENCRVVLKAGAKSQDADGLLRRFIEAQESQFIDDEITLDIAKALLPSLKDVRGFRAQERSLLTWAVMRSQRALLDTLLEAGADVNAADLEGLTPLHWAACIHDEAMMKDLRNVGANPLTRDKNGLTAQAIWDQKRLVSRGSGDSRPLPELSAASDDVWSAVAKGDEAAVKKLGRVAAVFAVSRGGVYPIHLAAARGHTGVMEIILELAPEARATLTLDGLSLMKIAVNAGQFPSVLWLVNHPGKVSQQQVLQEAAAASMKSHAPSILIPLLDSGWQPTTREERSKVLKTAIYRQEMGLLKRLIPFNMASDLFSAAEVTRNPFDQSESSMLACAVRSKSVELVRSLRRITLEAPELDWGPQWVQALAFCSHEEDEVMLRYLLDDVKIDINKRSSNDETALHQVARLGLLPASKWLILHGSRVDLINSEGQTPAQVARKEGFAETADWLESQAKSQPSGNR